MRIFEFDFENTQHFAEEEEFLILWRPMRSRLARTCNMPAYLECNEEFLQVCNTFSVNGRNINGVYYFKARNMDEFEDLSHTLNEMGIPHLLAEKEFAAATTEQNFGNSN